MKTATAPAALWCAKTNYVSVKIERTNNAFRLFSACASNTAHKYY